MKARALVKTYYNRQDRMPGDVFEMDDRAHIDIQIMKALGKIEEVKNEASIQRKEETKENISQTKPYETKVAEVEQDQETSRPANTTEGDALTAPARKTYYRRRDMRADK